MSQTFLEDIPEFLEIQRDSFLRILDTGLIQAFEKINPISPTSQSKYGLLFYPKEYVLILPENTITEAFLQGKTYGCKIYVPAVIYDIENSSTFQKTTFSKKRLKFSKALRFQKTIGSRLSEEILFSFGEMSSKVSIENSFYISKLSFYKRNTIGVKGSSFFLPYYLGFLEKKTNNHIKTVSQENGNFFDFQSLKNQTSLTPNFKSSQPIWKWISYVLKTRKNKSSDGVVGLDTAQKTKKKSQALGDVGMVGCGLKEVMVGSERPTSSWARISPCPSPSDVGPKGPTAKKRWVQRTLPPEKSTSLSPSPPKSSQKIMDVNNIFPKAIQQKSKLGRVDKAPMWLRGISNHSLIPVALEKYSLHISGGLNFLTVINNEKTHSLAWFLPLSKRSLIIKRKFKLPSLAWSQKDQLVENSLKPTLNIPFKFQKKVSNYARPVSSKEWVCIGVLPLMTPRGHFIINGSHRIIISQMARAPGLYYQTGEKLQATIVPSKGAWLRINVKANDTGEIKVWVRITPQRKIPYKIFIETYKYLENSKSIINSSSSKFLNLVYKTLNSKIKHLDKHYAIGVISGQITRTLLNSASYSLGKGGRKRLNERIGINEKNGYLTSKDISIIKDNLLKLLGQKSNALSSDDIDHLRNRRVRTCGELLQVEIETGMTRLKKAIGKQLDDYSNPDSSIFNTANHTLHSPESGQAEENAEKGIYNSKGSSKNTPAFSSSFNSKTPRFSCFYKNFWNLVGFERPTSTKNFSEWTILGYGVMGSSSSSPLDMMGSLSPSPFVGSEGRGIVGSRVLRTQEGPTPEDPTKGPYTSTTEGLELKEPIMSFRPYQVGPSDMSLQDVDPKNSTTPGGLFFKNKNLLFDPQTNLYVTSKLNSKLHLTCSKLVYRSNKVGTNLAFARFLNKSGVVGSKGRGSLLVASNEVMGSLSPSPSEPSIPMTYSNWGQRTLPVQKKMDISRLADLNDPRYLSLKKGFQFPKENALSPSKIIGTKAFAGALREFFGSNPLSQYMDQTNPLAEMTHKRRLSSLGPGGIDRASAGIAIRGIHPSHYGRICPIETPEGKNAGLVNSMTMWARINGEGFLETPYFKVTGGSVMSHASTSLMEQWNFLSTKSESEQALKIVSSDLKITQSAFLPSIALPTRDGSERSFGRQKRDYVQFCGVSPMQNISVATSLIPFLEHDDATRALMGSNMQRQAVPLLKATAPLIRTGLEGKVVGESGHALQASCSGIISMVTRTKVAIDSFEETQKTRSLYNAPFRPFSNQKGNNDNSSLFSSFFSPSQTSEASWTKKQKFIGNITLLPFLNEIVSTSSFYLLPEKIELVGSRGRGPFGPYTPEQKALLQTSSSRKLLPPKVGFYFNDFTKKIYKSKLSYLSKKKTLVRSEGLGHGSRALWAHVLRTHSITPTTTTNLRSLTTVTFSKNLWRKCSQIKRHRKIHDLQQYSRSNQATVCVQNPAVPEGRWVQKGDLIGDCSASKNGVLALGQNIVVAYLPMEGFNFEDAIVVSDRLVHEELYTSIHVQRVEFDMDARVKKHIPRKFKVKKQKSSYKTNNQDWITFFNPHLLQSEKQNLNPLGIIKVGSWVGPGDVLVSKVFPVERKIAPSRHLLAAVFQEKKTKILDTDDTSVRVPKGIHGRVINVKMTGIGKTASGPLLQSCALESLRQEKGRVKAFSSWVQRTLPSETKPSFSKTTTIKTNSGPVNKIHQAFDKNSYSSFSSGGEVCLQNTDVASTCLSLEYQTRKIKITGSRVEANSFDTKDQQNLIGWDKKNLWNKGIFKTSFDKKRNTKEKTFVYLESREQAHNLASKKLPFSMVLNDYKSVNKRGPSLIGRLLFQEVNNNFCLTNKSLTEPKVKEVQNSNHFHNSGASVNETSSFLNSFIDQEYKITGVRIYIAERKKLQVGDKMSGRHGNKGIVSTILPREDMPYLPDGTPVDMVLNPLGIPSRMNVGQVFECLLGLAASICDKSIGHTPFDEMYGPEASRSLVYLFLYVSRLKSRADWIFQPHFPGKTLLFDGRTGTPFEQWVTVGRAYMLKLIHMVDEKIHARSIGPRSLVTQQPVKGRARGGGQRLGEMEIWALEGFGAAYTLQEILTIKSDDIKGREDVETSIISATPLSSHIPETFRITLFELRCLCLNLELNQNF